MKEHQQLHHLLWAAQGEQQTYEDTHMAHVQELQLLGSKEPDFVFS